MNKILTSVGVLLLSTSALHANAANYSVSGTFNSPNVNLSIGDPADALSGGGLTVGGNILTDTNTAGYSVTGGTITLNGSLLLNVGFDIDVAMSGLSGTATNAGVLFNTGSVCVSAFTVGGCDIAYVDVSVDNISFLSGAAWGDYSALGLQLAGGAGGASFTVAQPGLIADVGLEGATGAADLLGVPAGIFLGGDLTFTEVSEVPVPAAAWLFGSSLLGLTGIARRRRVKKS